ncbi:hypothetical protein FCH28_22545 [Streptomyces piniterrae]|uniref:Secreted protein n=1 Tax=Streptomyces piniterrae TaxID=2571125 RepID=A0A4U0NJK8_9ACTN|nr:hypothetical protein [Streptomyces piniterrae]TJZ50104.1 hypothetical protein FCH28_22545 [Streptomyces piniterrae]
MRKLRKAAVVVAILGSVSLIGAGTAYADAEADGSDYSRQSSSDYDRQQQADRDYGQQQQSDRGYEQQQQSDRGYDQQQANLEEEDQKKSKGRHHGHKKPSSVWRGDQSTTCTANDKNIDKNGQVGYGNGVGGNADGGTGDPGGQTTTLGSSMNCSITVDNSSYKDSDD